MDTWSDPHPEVVSHLGQALGRFKVMLGPKVIVTIYQFCINKSSLIQETNLSELHYLLNLYPSD